MKNMTGKVIWIKCPDCDGYYCTKHQEHTDECDCPPIDEMKFCPYTGVLQIKQKKKQ